MGAALEKKPKTNNNNNNNNKTNKKLSPHSKEGTQPLRGGMVGGVEWCQRGRQGGLVSPTGRGVKERVKEDPEPWPEPWGGQSWSQWAQQGLGVRLHGLG